MATIKSNGIFQKDLVTLLTNIVALVNECKASINATNAQLDADGGVTDTDYAANNDVAGTNLSLTV